MASELHPWKFELDIFSKSVTLWTPTDMYLSPNCVMAQQCAICEALFSKCFEQSTSWCFGSHFFVARSHRFIATCHCRFLASFLKGKAWNENSFVNFTLQPTAAHSLGMLFKICQTTFNSILFKSLLSRASQLSCRDVTGVTWPKPGIFSCRRRSCSKRRVCFHSNQYFYVPQENVSVKWTACMLNFIYVGQCLSDIYDLKSVFRGPLSPMSAFTSGAYFLHNGRR